MKHESEPVIKYLSSVFTQTSANDGVMPLMDARACLPHHGLRADVKLTWTHIEHYIKSSRAWMAQGHEPHLKLYRPVKAVEISLEMLADVLSSWVRWLQVLFSTLHEDNYVVPSAKWGPLLLQHAHPEEGAAGISPHQGVCGRAPHQAGPIMDFLAPWPNQKKKKEPSTCRISAFGGKI